MIAGYSPVIVWTKVGALGSLVYKPVQAALFYKALKHSSLAPCQKIKLL